MASPGSVFEYGSALAEMLSLLACVFRALAEVDEVEVDTLDPRTARVLALEVGLANLLGGLDVLIMVIIRVEAGAEREFGKLRGLGDAEPAT